MEPLFEVQLELAAKGSRQSALTLYQQLKAAMLDGRLRPGTRLPPTRRSGTFFGISRNTVAQVYERLLNEGYVTARHGSGTYVSQMLPAPLPSAVPVVEDARDHRLNAFWTRPDVTAAMGFWRDPPESPTARRRSAPVDFRPAMTDSRLFPFDIFRRVSAKQLRGLENKPASFKSAQGNQGNFHLRTAITNHIALTRAVVCQADDVIVTAGAQQAFDLIARVLVTPGKTVVAVEDPGYPPMRVAFAAAGARLVRVGIDAEGIIIDELPTDVGIICVCPSHQFPLGIAMSKRRRAALIEFARQRAAVIVEDDYDGEFRHDGGPLGALRTAAAADVVFYVGTFSKCMLSALRLGFLIAPEWAMPTLIAAKNCMDWHCSTPVQIGVARFISEGHLARHVRKMRTIYKRRRQLLLKILQEDLRAWLKPVPGVYGMHIAALSRSDLDLDRVTGALLRQNVKLHTFTRYYLGAPTAAGLIFGYGVVDAPQIRRGLALLHQALSVPCAE